tara:strand:- start:57 stop:551 length:495 start_codon:yes stop_codon:yes gene_type:complete
MGDTHARSKQHPAGRFAWSNSSTSTGRYLVLFAALQSDLASLGYVLVELLSGRADFLGPLVSAQSTRSLGNAERKQLVEAKQQLPARLTQLLPKVHQGSERLMRLLRSLIDPDPEKRIHNAEDATDGSEGTNKFKEELVLAKLSMNWVQVIKYWLEDVTDASRG